MSSTYLNQYTLSTLQDTRELAQRKNQITYPSKCSIDNEIHHTTRVKCPSINVPWVLEKMKVVDMRRKQLDIWGEGIISARSLLPNLDTLGINKIDNCDVRGFCI